MITDSNLAGVTQSLDHEACAREPIHIPGAIQPHGCLLVYRAGDREILQVSENSQPWLGLSPRDILGRKLEAVLGRPNAELVAQAAGSSIQEAPLTLQIRDTPFQSIVHPLGERVIVEIERDPELEADSPGRLLAELAHLIARLQRARDLPHLCTRASEAIAAITGFDRVMVYKFDHEWNGEVIAEVKAPDMDPYLGLRYPSSDIPAQARQLYRSNWIRLIPDSSYTAIPMVPAMDPETGRPLDMSRSSLRSVSPIHLEYLQNMGVTASMSISLIREGELWGLIACHHRTAKILGPSRRAACQLVGQVMSAEITAKENAEHSTAKLEARTVQARFFEYLAEEDNFLDALLNYTPELLDLMGAAGAALFAKNECRLLGSTPAADEVSLIVERLRAQKLGVFQTNALSEWHPESERYREQASGILALALSDLRTDYLIWFRPEVVSTVTWAGNPTKAAEEGTLRLHPRKSFDAWKEEVTGKSNPWTELEIAAALELRAAINATILKQYDRLRNLNSELERKNHDLDSFAYIAGHDLKEPLRSIRNTSTWLLEDYGEQIAPEFRERLQTIADLGDRLEQMLEALLHFSRVGRKQLKTRTADMNEVLKDALELLKLRIEESGVEVIAKGPLPPAEGDPKLLTEIFTNLISNAIKYNTSDHKVVEIGAEMEPDGRGNRRPVYYVSDNGIGVRDKQQEEVFRIFRRLHTRDSFGGGTGAGLAIVKTIVERHGGAVRLTSEPGVGSKFSFTLRE